MKLITFCALAGMSFAIACGGGTKPTTTTATTPEPSEGSAATTTEAPSEPHGRRNMKSLTPSELSWTPVEPGTGEKGPMMAPLWGDAQSESKGLLVKLPSGATGILHTHGGVYHGVAMTDGTFDVAQVKLANAPKAVEPSWKAATWKPFDEKNPKAGAWAAVWGDSKSEPSGMYVKIPAGNETFWHIHKADYHAVVLAGTLNNIESGSEPTDLPAGSYYMQPGGYKHTTNCKAGGPDCILYVYATGAYDTKAM